MMWWVKLSVNVYPCDKYIEDHLNKVFPNCLKNDSNKTYCSNYPTHTQPEYLRVRPVQIESMQYPQPNGFHCSWS